jgi:hypothetical protein
VFNFAGRSFCAGRPASTKADERPSRPPASHRSSHGRSSRRLRFPIPHVGQGANQAIEDAVALATVLGKADATTAPQALQVHEAVRRQHTARVQTIARTNGARYDGATSDLGSRDRQLADQAQERAWIWDYDAEVEAAAAP